MSFWVFAEIVKIVLIIVLLSLSIVWIKRAIKAEEEKTKAFQGLQKGFHVEYVVKDADVDEVIGKIAESMSKQIDELGKY